MMNKQTTQKTAQFKILDHCIACTTCSSVSPKVFKLNHNYTIAMIINQPTNEDDSTKSMRALKSCPVAAIGVTYDNG